MEELKNLRNYEEFKEAVNEELLWDAVKNLFSKLFGKMDKRLADAVNNFTKKIDGSKSYQESVKYFEETLAERSKGLDELYKNATAPYALRKLMADGSEALFVTCQIMSNKYQSPALAAKNIFKGTPDEKLFNFDSSEDFKKNITAAMNMKMIELNKKSTAYDEKALTDYLNKNTEIDKVEQPTTPTDNNQQTPTDNNQQTPTDNKQPNPNLNLASIIYDFNDTLNEDAATKMKPSNIPANAPMKKTTNTTNQPTPTESTATTPDPNAPPKGDINKLRQASDDWVVNLYGTATKKVKEIKAPAAGAGGADPFDAVAKNTKATGNTQNLAKLLRNIVNIPDAATLAKVRDEIAKAQKKDPTKFAEEIGKF